ncbi:glutamine-hydrolyzing GMP synthase [Patescibacteria group bacterium]|nr:glutamine-hydrolyzing GMP synthase [Patescibacteria group bacterium]
MNQHSKIAILDYGSQYTHLLATRIRRLGVYSEILDTETPATTLKDYKGIILSGGPASVYAPGAPQADPAIFDLKIPILGVCYGHQLMTQMLGGTVERGTGKGSEYGKAQITITDPAALLTGISPQTQVWMSHGDRVTALPEGFRILASSKDDPYSVVGDPSRNFYGIQFHAEVKHTFEGKKILENFINLTGASRDWNLGDFIEQKTQEIRTQVGDRRVFMLVSGGVDSSVAFVLLEKAIGAENVYGLFVDTGFMRKGEREQVEEMLQKAGVKNLHVEDASQEFFRQLAGVTDPEHKREIIGRVFLEIQKRVSENLKLNPDEWLLGQGTIYPDTIESGGTKRADKIKTHHNRVPEIEELIRCGRIIEPLADLYKDEVREVGTRLGLPEQMVWRHPFPGPGLAVRILCTTAADWPENHQDLDAQINQFLAPHHLTAHTLPIKSVGVQGDERTYRHPVVIQGPATWEQLEEIAPALTNRFSEINRVLYLLSPDKIETVQINPGDLNPNRTHLLQQADHIAMNWLRQIKKDREVWQMPTVLLPVSINTTELHDTLVLRPIISDEAMTANFAQLPMPEVRALAQLLAPFASAVLYDITNKPPGTIEWE